MKVVLFFSLTKRDICVLIVYDLLIVWIKSLENLIVAYRSWFDTYRGVWFFLIFSYRCWKEKKRIEKEINTYFCLSFLFFLSQSPFRFNRKDFNDYIFFYIVNLSLRGGRKEGGNNTVLHLDVYVPLVVSWLNDSINRSKDERKREKSIFFFFQSINCQTLM